MEGKHEEFWNQGDFGYVKKEVDSMMTLCKPLAKVCTGAAIKGCVCECTCVHNV